MKTRCAVVWKDVVSDENWRFGRVHRFWRQCGGWRYLKPSSWVEACTRHSIGPPASSSAKVSCTLDACYFEFRLRHEQWEKLSVSAIPLSFYRVLAKMGGVALFECRACQFGPWVQVLKNPVAGSLDWWPSVDLQLTEHGREEGARGNIGARWWLAFGWFESLLPRKSQGCERRSCGARRDAIYRGP